MAISSRLKQLVGKTTKPVIFEVEKGQIRRFAMAIGEERPIHRDEQAAIAAGFRSLVAPPTFPCVFDASAELYELLGLDAQATMHAEEEYEYFRTMVAGDVLSVTHRIADVYDKPAQNGRLVFAVIETRANDQRARPVYKGRRVLVELKK
ncbi:MAG: MaoC family dehydratase N-terminal domain-containing protein [Myxococcota bacterium]